MAPGDSLGNLLIFVIDNTDERGRELQTASFIPTIRFALRGLQIYNNLILRIFNKRISIVKCYFAAGGLSGIIFFVFILLIFEFDLSLWFHP